MFFKEILKWFYFQIQCFQSHIFKIVFQVFFHWEVSIGAKAMIIWFATYRLPSDAVTVSSAEELHRRYGDVLPALAVQNPTPYRLTRVLKARTPPLYVSDAVLKQWFQRYFDAEPKQYHNGITFKTMFLNVILKWPYFSIHLFHFLT